MRQPPRVSHRTRSSDRTLEEVRRLFERYRRIAAERDARAPRRAETAAAPRRRATV